MAINEKLIRRLIHVAVYAVIRGFATAAGSAALAAAIWWLQSH